MSKARLRSGRTTSLRLKLLAIVLIPGLVVLGVGLAVTLRAIDDAKNDKNLAESVGPAADGAVAFIPLVEAERRASLKYSVSPTPEARAQLEQARGNVDQLTAQLDAAVQDVLAQLPGSVQALIGEFGLALSELPAMRTQVDNRQVTRTEIYDFFNRITDVVYTGTEIIGAEAIDAEVAARRHTAALVMLTADQLDRSNAYAVAGVASGTMTRAEFDEFVRGYGSGLGALDSLIPLVDQQTQAQIEQIRNSPEWRQFVQTSDALVGGGHDALTGADGDGPAVIPDVTAWERAATTVATGLFQIGVQRSAAAAELEQSRASEKVDDATLAAVLMTVGTLLVFAIALIMSTRLVRRLAKLRADTLSLANKTLPDTVEKLKAGQPVDVATEIPRLEHGRDEIGQVASAFNLAQQTAVRAAVDEAQTRAGINAVFLNIARRSQNIVHRQLQVLDEVERSETDPDQLALLFQLDHLATRERRNAENLIILGGQQPGRQWRNPVLLTELVRSAIGETEQYQRVTPGRLPRVLVAGKAVGDLVHLLAELVDNATGFSPPDSPIEVSGTTVGRGVVIEVEDQGLGMTPELRDELNEMLRNPPDFGLMTLSGDSRLGLFVVARLANRHGMTVTLRESAYGGVKAGVLIPTALVDVHEPDRTRPESGSLEIVDATANGRRLANGTAPPSAAAHGGPHDGDHPELAEPVAARIPLHRAQVEPPRTSPPPPAELPQLPRRRRLSHIDPRLRDQIFEDASAPSELVDVPQQTGPAHSPDTVRHRMSALQRGTRRGRTEDAERGSDAARLGAEETMDTGRRRNEAHAGDEGA